MQELPEQDKYSTEARWKANEKDGNGKQTDRTYVLYPANADEKAQWEVEILAKTTDKKIPDEPCKDVLAVLETREVSLFNNDNYKVSMSISMNSSQIHRIEVYLTLVRVQTSLELTFWRLVCWILYTSATCRTTAVHLTASQKCLEL